MQAPTPAYFADLVDSLLAVQDEATRRWHEEEPAPEAAVNERPGDLAAFGEALRRVVREQHRQNFLLWHVEDEARRRDVDDSVIAGCKRRIDPLNQARNDGMERIDAALLSLLDGVPTTEQAGINTESPGAAIDRLSILSLKIWHMDEEARREGAGPEHMAACARKLAVLREQRADLAAALKTLLADYLSGARRLKVYYQFKMYNDPNLNPKLYGAAGRD